MGFVRQFLRDYGYIHRSEIRRPHRSRAYEAARMDRLTSDFLSTANSIDQDIRAGMVRVRGRARHLAQNNEFARAYLRACKKNIVGADGFKLQVKAIDHFETDGQPVLDEVANNKIEAAFADWSRPQNATVTKKLSFRKLQELVIESTARDGETLTRIVRNTSINPYAFSLEPVEPDLLDVNYNGKLENGNVVRMGVELNPWKQPVAYYLTTQDVESDVWGKNKASGPKKRIPAENMIHLFDPERPDQTRGISWMAPIMLGLHNLHGYIEGAIINARAGANKLGFFSNKSGGTNTSPLAVEDADADGNPIDNIEPATFTDIGDKEFHGFDPKYPDGQFDPFVKSILRGISSGLGVSFSSLSNDLTEVNFSSIRAGLLEERETWKSLQSWFIESFLNRVFSEWLSMAILTNMINLPAGKLNKFDKAKWTGRRWGWVKPAEEVKAWKDSIDAGLKSATRVISEDGGDIQEVYQEISRERKLAEKYGLNFNGGQSNGSQASAGNANQESASQNGNPGATATSPGAQADEDIQPRPGNGAG